MLQYWSFTGKSLIKGADRKGTWSYHQVPG